MIPEQILYTSSHEPALCGELDEKSFEAFFRENFLRLCVYCQYKFGFDTDLAKEVVHTGFIKLWETRQKITTGASLKTYLYKIISNNCLDILRHEKVKTRYEKSYLNTFSEASRPLDFAGIDLKQLESDIHAAIAQLPEQMRRIFEMSRFEGLKYNEISRHLGISPKTVETQMSRALVKLRQRFRQYLTLCLLFSIISLR